ncbi:MAG: hypothetical protein F4X81_05245 [Gammaproteobacteria bacterium]|nr:hypothetical protein [Gammaproteobacteria bacterium]
MGLTTGGGLNGALPGRTMPLKRETALLLRAAFALVLAAGVAEAQTLPGKLVSNTGQARELFYLLWTDAADYAQAFTTGSNTAGYTMTDVDLIAEDDPQLNPSRPAYAVSIRSDLSGVPGRSLGTLANPPSLPDRAQGSPARFRASGGGIGLDPSTRYWVVIDISTGTVSSAFYGARSFAEDSDGMVGWSIADGLLSRSLDDSGSWQASSRTDAVQLAVYGRDGRPPSSSGSGGGGSGADRRPEVLRELGAGAVALGAALTLDLSEAFRARGGGALAFTATSSDPAVAEASVDGATLTVRGRAAGEAEIAVTATDGEGRSITQRFVVTVTAPEAAWHLPPASHPNLQGFLRVINRSDRAGEVTVTATDDAGVEYEPVTLALGAHQARHFNSGDLEDGNPAKGLTGSTGPGTGGWRLEFESDALDVEALAHLRTADGFVTGMGATAPKGDDGRLRLATFNPASNTSQVSRLRLVNPTDADAEATVTGVDDAGNLPGEPVVLTLPAGSACEVDAPALESGRGLACGAPQAGLGDGKGKWRLAIESDAPLVAMGLLSSPTGHLTNLSGASAADADGIWHVPLFPPASDPEGRQGFVRFISRSGRDGVVTVRAFDDSDFDYQPLTLRLGAGQAVQFNADDLEVGNAGKGLRGSTGPGTGAWRLELSSNDIEFEAHAYVRHRDGFLTAMQAAGPSAPAEGPSAGRVHRIATLNPGSNSRQVGVLRLVNRGAGDAAATVTGADDRGVRPGGPVEVSVPAGAAVELTAAELEAGESDAIASGALGDGVGKWRLRVASESDLAVMGLLRGPMGHLSNLSRSGAFGALPSLPPPPASVVAEHAGGPRVQAEWAEVPGMRYGVDLLLDGAPVEGRSRAATTRTDFRWSGLEPGTYSIRVRSVDADGAAGPWGEPSNEVLIE